VIASVPFVNFHWKSNIFLVEFWNKKSTWFKVEPEFRHRLGGITIKQGAQDFLIRLSRIADDMDKNLSWQVDLRDEIGLTQAHPNDG
jgi:hypothetical protein